MMRRDLLAVVGLLTIASACSNELEGPAPAVSDGTGEQAATEPSFVCNEQLDTWVTLRGESFSPLVVDALDDPSVVLPELVLTRSSSVEGEAGGDAFTVTLADSEADRLKWISSEEMRLRISPDLELPAGIYDITVTNENGESTTGEAAFGVLPRPEVSGVVPAYACLSEGERSFVVEGDHFLVQGETLPQVIVGGESFTPSAADGCRDLGAVFGGAQLCESLTFALPQEQFEPGVEDVVVQNGDPAACASLPEEDGSELRIVPPPAVAEIIEELACVTEGDRSFVINGSDFVIDGETHPTVHVGDKSYAAEASDCEEVAVYNGAFQRCTQLGFTVPQGDLPDGVHAVSVTNPDPAGCTSSETLELTITPPPTVSDIAPEVVCSEQLENTLTITGTGFLTVEGETPTVTIAGTDFTSTASDCEAVPSVLRTTVERCTTLSVTVPADTIADGQQDVTVTNPMPAGCSSTDAVTVTFVPPPAVDAIVRDFTCLENASGTALVEGVDFLRVGTETPVVTIGGTEVAVLEMTECTAVPGTTDVESCTTLEVELAEGALAIGTHDIVVTNPQPAACNSTETVSLEVVGPPALTAVAPSFFCGESGDTELTVTGTDFYVVDGANPSVIIGGQSYAATPTATSCTATSRTGVEICTELTATLPAGSATSGSLELAVVNPEPVACTSVQNASTFVGGAPNITSYAPQAACGDDTFDGVITATGDSILRIDGAAPTVDVAGTPADSVTLGDCTQVGTMPTGEVVESCTELVLVVPQALRAQDLTITIANPAPSACGSTQIDFVQAPTPTIASVTPLRVCDEGGTIALTGTEFQDGMTVTLGTATASSVTVDASGTSATATFDGPLTTGLYDVTVTNPNTCFATYETQVRVVPGPTPFYVDPPVVYDGITTQVTIYLTGLFGGSVTDISLVDTAGTATALSYTFDPTRPNTVQAIVPSGLLAAGLTSDLFDVKITDDVSCSGSADDLLEVTNELTVAVEDVIPPFGWTQATTAVSVTAMDTPPAGETQFQPTPRVYLNPVTAGASAIATELSALQFVSETELAGVVPSGLPVDAYDLIVVNPDGSVGVLSSAFDVTLNPPPTVSAVSPGSWKLNESALPVQIEGANFRQPSAEVTCRDNSGATDTLTVAIDTTNSTDSLLLGTVNTSSVAVGAPAVCSIRVTNGDDLTYGDYAPITLTNPAGNFVDFVAGPSMTTARRAAASVGASPTTASSFVYAIGGDDGALANPLTSLEATPLDRFGTPGDWFTLPYALPEGRTMAGAVRVDDFVYLVGGHDGTSPVSTVWRAQILDPLSVPDITNVEFDIDPNLTSGPAPGVYYYRVAAILAPMDAANPGGETLASDPQPVRVPFQGVDVTLDWTPYPNAVEYRIYRSASPDISVGNEELLATVTTTSFIDDGTGSTAAGVTPLRLGSLGKWREVATLNTARYAHAVTAAPDPDDADTWYVYAIGGNDGTGALDSYEYVPVTIGGAGDQTVGAAVLDDTTVLSVGRYELSAVLANPTNASYLAESYIYALGGKQTNGSLTRTVEYAAINPGGSLGSWTPTDVMQRSRAGYATALANNTFVTAGGHNATANDSADKGLLCDGISCTPAAPAINQWSSLSAVNMQARYLMGYSSFRGLLYMLGGETGTATASSTIDYSILGGTP